VFRNRKANAIEDTRKAAREGLGNHSRGVGSCL
jgi:hypothetical protein